MNYSAINIQGNILSSEVLEKVRTEDIRYQIAKDFGLDPSSSVRDEISLSWSLALSHWKAFKQKRENLSPSDSGTTETRNYWMKPLMSLLGYDLTAATAEIINGKTYAISFRAANLDNFPVHIVGINQSLDARAESGGTRLSPHALAQEYLNNQEHLYALVSNGKFLRLLRDATRLSRLSYLEFNLEQIMEESLYAEFALLYRVLHASRMPQKGDAGADSILEFYHQEALASGSRIRERLSVAVETSIKELANGFLRHSQNEVLRKAIADHQLDAQTYYLYNLRIIYRVLFLMVIEERKLIFPAERDGKLEQQRAIYYNYYSVQRLSRLVEKAVYVDPKKTDLWSSLVTCFALFEHSQYGAQLGIAPLGSGLFAPVALGIMGEQVLDNETVLRVLRHLVTFESENGQKVRVNYADLDVEEFGSVYEGLLEYEPQLLHLDIEPVFIFKEGKERSKSGSHYTPEELVKPLIQHSLDYLIQERLKEPKKFLKEEQIAKASSAGESLEVTALLKLRVCDVACGSGHILLSAARRIGFELAKLRSKEDQPSPTVIRQAVRDTIANCIYGVDKNPLAVELCKVAMWLEAHNPGKPLNFLDHHIKCGDAIVGLTHKEELENGIADEAFKRLPTDDKDVASSFLKRNKAERIQKEQATFDFDTVTNAEFTAIIEKYSLFESLPEGTPEEVVNKENQYRQYEKDNHRIRMKQLADAQVAQFFIAKTDGNKPYILTDAEYRKFLREVNDHLGVLQSSKLNKAQQEGIDRKFFHWFLEFPEVFNQGGFDCILGNPPYLHNQKLSGFFGHEYLNFIQKELEISGSCDLVTYFVRRIFKITTDNSFFSIITTNSISQGRTREQGLEVILQNGGNLNFVHRSIKWSGVADLYVSCFTLSKGNWKIKKYLDKKEVLYISSYFDDTNNLLNPYTLKSNIEMMFQGSIYLGEGFLINDEEKKEMISHDPKNAKVIFGLLSGRDVNESFIQKPSSNIINFFNWDEEKAKVYEKPYSRLKELVKPERQKEGNLMGREKWWQYYRRGVDLYNALEALSREKKCFITIFTSKYLNFSEAPTDLIFTNGINVLASDKYYMVSCLQSNLHQEWARKYGSTLKNDLRYTPTKCFETYPFPQNLTNECEVELDKIGKTLLKFRKKLMSKIRIGLTKTYNLFHSKNLTIDKIIEESKQGFEICKDALSEIITLRELHRQIDKTVLGAYGWEDIDLSHDFYDVDYLPEKDRIRYTIHPIARKEVLKRLLELNNKIHAEEVTAGLWDKKGKKESYSTSDDEVSTVEESDEALGGLFNQSNIK